jgi:hypothetical protein
VAESKSNSLSAVVTTLLGPVLNFRKEEVLVIAAEACKTRTLTNSTNFFFQASKSSIVQDWLEQVWREGKKAYIMVGIKTILDAQITLQLAKSKEVAFQTKLPGSLVLTAATQGIISTLGGLETLLDSEVSTTHEQGRSSLSSYIMPGEHIIAIQYRKVDFAWFRRGSFNAPGLKDATSWKVYVGSRGGEEIREDGRGDGDEQGTAESGESDEGDDEEVINLQVAVGESIGADDIGEFSNRQEFVGDGGDEIWYVD